jgi:hypothetical protein
MILFVASKFQVQNEIPYQISFKPPKICPVSYQSENMQQCKTDADCSHCVNSTCVDTETNETLFSVDGEKSTKLPTGSFCIPKKIDDTVPCNKFTGLQVLTKIPAMKKFLWRCHCKNPNIVSNKGVWGDCTHVTACGKGNLVCPPNGIFGKCLPDQIWTQESDWDPSLGVCLCPKGLKFVEGRNGQKLCVNDNCFPGIEIANRCVCNQTRRQNENGEWISDVPSASGQSCVPDPCNPNGYFENGRCICNPKSVPKKDESVVGGWTCESPCGTTEKNNPCGNRGKCVVDVNYPNNYRCFQCKYPNFQDENQLCLNIVKPSGSRCNHNSECETGFCSPLLGPYVWIPPFNWREPNWKDPKYCGYSVDHFQRRP